MAVEVQFWLAHDGSMLCAVEVMVLLVLRVAARQANTKANRQRRDTSGRARCETDKIR